MVAFAALGPEWRDGEDDRLDILVLSDPDVDQERLADLLAGEIERRLHAYQVQHPKIDVVLRPRNPNWLAHAPALGLALGLLEEAEDEEDDEEG